MASVKRLIQNGESLVYVKDQLGHHSIKVTVDVYGHLVPRGEQGGRGPARSDRGAARGLTRAPRGPG